jgi:hypothetical protein
MKDRQRSTPISSEEKETEDKIYDFTKRQPPTPHRAERIGKLAPTMHPDNDDSGPTAA